MTPAWSSSRIGRLRIRALTIIETLESGHQSVCPSIVMNLASIQDQITILKHRNIARTAKDTNFDWVDTWAPH